MFYYPFTLTYVKYLSFATLSEIEERRKINNGLMESRVLNSIFWRDGTWLHLIK